MNNTKWIGLSKTILGILLMAVVTFAPLIGISFSEADATFITKEFDAILEAVGAALAIYGRFKATAGVKLFPSGDGGMVRSPWIISIAAVGLLLITSACSFLPSAGGLTADEQKQLSPTARYYQVESEFAIALDEAALYSARPFCSDVLIIACAEPSVVIALDDAKDSVRDKLDTAQALILVIDTRVIAGIKAQEDSLASANIALGALTAILITVLQTINGA